MRQAFTGEPVVGAIRGFRWWTVGETGWLQSLYRRSIRWQPDSNQASCLRGHRRWLARRWRAAHPDGPPASHCTCGFYGLHRPPLIGENLWQMDPVTSSGHRGIVFGVAAGWGRILVGTRGWRAEFARPVALYVSGVEPLEAAEDVAPLASRYAIPVLREFDALIAEWGPTLEEVEAFMGR